MIDAVKTLRPGPIDIHAHIMPEALIRRLAAGERSGSGVAVHDKGGRRHRLGEGGPSLPLLPGMSDTTIRLRAIDENVVAAQAPYPWIALSLLERPSVGINRYN